MDYWHRQVNESDLDKTSRPQNEAVEPREQRDSVVLCQIVSLSPSAQRSLFPSRLLSHLPISLSLTFIYVCLQLFGLLRCRFHCLSAIISVCPYIAPIIHIAPLFGE